jgi:hypothetical protein
MEASIEKLNTGDPTLANRYLADQMSPEEREAFEERMVTDPAVLREVELTARFKEGLSVLRESGELAKVLEPPRSHLPGLAAAAAVAVLAIALGIWRMGTGGAEPWGAASLQALVAQRQTELPLGQRYTVLRVRSAEQVDTVIELPATRQAIELRVLPDSGDANSRYRVTLSPLDDSRGRSLVLKELRPDGEGYLGVFLDSAALEAGQYRLVADQESTDDVEGRSSFLIEITPRGASP